MSVFRYQDQHTAFALLVDNLPAHGKTLPHLFIETFVQRIFIRSSLFSRKFYTFFMRVEFSTEKAAPDEDALNKRFDEQVRQRFSMRWKIIDKQRKSRVLILVSKYGHCLNDVLYR